MAVYTDLPTLEANFLAPLKTTFDVVGSSIEGGRSATGETVSMEMSGGGIVTATYDDCKIRDEEQFEYINMLGARLNGSFRFINVPIPTDWFGPFPIINKIRRPIITGIPHSDGSYFDDGSGYSQTTVWGKITASAALNAGIVRMRVYGLSRPLRWSDWFSIYHPTKGWRAYRYWEVLDRYSDGTETIDGTPTPYQEYLLAIAPPLREAVTSGTRVEFARPRFVARFPAGFTLPSVIEAFFVTQQSIQFTEAF
ncbi:MULTISPECIES: hypothetical protein [unclassified Rhizobium]|uniref:hypothetical protein n=1 Tax=unclassified Rhizobium TaxID=2613769 RepID=UPI0006F774AC|nr:MULTISPECIES: hypothetical protein [unclassified Rhizobium]KQV33147.1 hypothetical protein ASC86_18480 [Rhizobium sp. Root1212]KRD21607.1 hypothetical protein ASE37_18980 [Rhizobium sp. Root268]